MKWFRHETDGPTSEEITQLVKLTGFAGKGRWYTLKELVAAHMDNSDRCHVEYPSLEWGRFLGLKQKKLKTFLKHCENIFKIFVECQGEILKISIPKLLEERDFYSKRFEQNKKNVRTKIEIETKIKHPLPPQGGLTARKNRSRATAGGSNGDASNRLFDSPENPGSKGQADPLQKKKNGNVPEGIEKIRKICGRYPDKQLWESLNSLVFAISEEELRTKYTSWLSHGWNRLNYLGWINYDGKEKSKIGAKHVSSFKRDDTGKFEF